MHRLLLAAAAAFLVLSSTPCELRAQPVDQEPALSLHDRARTKFQELHRRMQALQTSKQSSEPEQSQLLQAGNRLIQERRIHERMESARQMIENGDYDRALESMGKVGDDLSALLALLLNRDLELDKLMERIEQLEKFRDRVGDLLDQQRAEKVDAAKSEALLEQLERIERARENVGRLIESQKKLKGDAGNAGMEAKPSEAKSMASREADLEAKAKELGEQLAEIESRANPPKPGESESADSNAPGGSGGEPGQGQKSIQGASQSMQDAKNDLLDNQPERSLDDMDKALEALDATKRELDRLAEDARRKLEQLPFDQQHRKQEQTRIDTDRLAQDMENAEQGEGEEPGQPTPGRENVQQAVPKQKSAAGQLREQKPAKAKQDQQDAGDDLERAKQQLEDALAQLRQQLEDEVLRALEERFGEMLARQKEISARTKAIDEVRRTSLTAADVIPAQVRNTCTELGNGEGELAGEASDALKLLEEDARSAAFPLIVEELRDDLQRASDRLARHECAATTQMIQAEIEATLNDLLNALRKTIEQRAGGT
ncbi:MAG: hypothetical protein KDB80_15310 [Planctomycetes bacterium]|nr:hypothetical protein [Planctomycetota bacterium]